MKRLMVLLSVTCLAIAVVGFAAPASAAEPIKIGNLFGFTGYMAPIAEEASRGLKVAVEKFMPTMGGRPVKLITEDTGTKADLAVQKVKKLVDRDKVAVVLGPVNGGHAMGTSAVTDKAEIPNLQLQCATGGLILKRKWTWGTASVTEAIGYPVGFYAYNELGYRTAVVIASDRHVGHEFMKGFYLSFKELGGQILQEQWFPPGTTQFAPYVAKLKKADVLVTWIGDADGIAAFPLIRQMGVKMPIMQPEHAGAMLSPKAALQIGPSIVGIITATWYVHTLDNPTNNAFVKAYKEEYGVPPGSFAGGAYEVIQILKQAFERTGGSTDPYKLREALMQPVDTLAGRVEWTKDRAGIHLYHLVEVMEDLTTPKVIRSFRLRADVAEKAGKKFLKISIVD
jgi:branched-chain amino acid transport system substrate-binding protein